VCDDDDDDEVVVYRVAGKLNVIGLGLLVGPAKGG